MNTHLSDSGFPLSHGHFELLLLWPPPPDCRPPQDGDLLFPSPLPSQHPLQVTLQSQWLCSRNHSFWLNNGGKGKSETHSVTISPVHKASLLAWFYPLSPKPHLPIRRAPALRPCWEGLLSWKNFSWHSFYTSTCVPELPISLKNRPLWLPP